MANRDIKIFLKTIADLTGITKLQLGIAGLTLAAAGLGAAFRGAKAVASAAIAGLGSALNAVKKGAIGVGVGMAGSVREFYVWNKEAARAWTMMDTGVAGFAAMRKEISKLSPELGVAKSELGKGWYQALSAGVEQDQLIPFLRTAAKVSIADGSSIETAIDGITTVLNAFGMKSSDVGKITDVMFKEVAKGKTTFAQLASSVAVAAPTAAAMGVSVEQLMGALATMTKQGSNPAEALNKIKNMMLIVNDTLGDGWAKTMTFQEALEKIAKSYKYSISALSDAKMFGSDNITGVMEMVGEKAAMAAADLREMYSSAGTLEQAFFKVFSQTAHWPRLWQGILALVGDVGEAIDTALRPAINFISEKLRSMRESGGFTGFLDKLGAAVSSTVTALVAGVQTAVDLLGKASAGQLISGAVNALVDTAVTLLAEGLRSLGIVMVALAKVFSAALAEDFMKLDIWGRDETKGAQKAALKKIKDLSPEQAASFGVPAEFTQSDSMMSPDQLKERQSSMQAWAGSLSLDQAAKIATSSRDTDINKALTDAAEYFAGARSRIAGAGEQIVDNLGRRTGEDIPALYAENVRKNRELVKLAPPPPEPKPEPEPESAAEPPAASPAPVRAPAKTQPKQRRCSAMTQYGNHCPRMAMPGRRYCKLHEMGDEKPKDFNADQTTRGWSVSQNAADLANEYGSNGKGGGKNKKKKGSADDSLSTAADEISEMGTVSADTALRLMEAIRAANQKSESANKLIRDINARAKQPGG